MVVETGACGDGANWSLNSDQILTISGSGAITSAPWRADYLRVIKEVIIEEGITSISVGAAFDSMTSLTRVSLPNTLVSIEGGDAFEYCSALESIVIPDSVTYVGSWAFAQCTSLKSVTMPAELPRFGGSVFSSCPIENLYISDLYDWCSLDSSDMGLTYENLILNGTPVVDLVIPEGITSISNYAYDYWTGLETVTIPESVTSIGAYAFRGCENLREVNLNAGITALHSYVFSECHSLTSLTLPETVQVLDSNAFRCNSWQHDYTSSLTELIFLGNAPLIASDAFTSVTANAYYSAANTSWTEDVFQNYGGTITWLPDSEIPGSGTEPEVYIIASGTCGRNVYWELDSTGLLTVYGGPGMRTVFGFGYEMDDYASAEETPWFAYRDQIQSVMVESTVYSIGDNAFAQCENLEEVTIADGVSEVGTGAFAQCESLEEVTFEGNAPTFGENCFEDVTATVNYPADDDSWDDSVLESAGGEMNMQPYIPEEQPTEPSVPETTEPTVPATTEPTVPETTEPTVPETTEPEPTEPEPTEPEPTEPEPSEPEEPDVPDGVIRLSGSNRYATGFAIANQLKELLGIEKFSTVIIAYGQNFPDALTGSYLAAVKNAPILLTEPGVDGEVINYLRNNLIPGGKVYILGGTSAVSKVFESASIASGFEVQRLKGAGRYETNLAILAEAGVNNTDEVLIATGGNYADSLSASATGLPMLLVDKKLTESQKAFLENTSKKFVILGGTGAVSAEVEAELAAIGIVTRVKGAGRYETSVEIARRYFENPRAAVLAYAQGFPDGLCGGPLALSMGAPLILTSNDSFRSADDYIEGISSGAVTGGTGRISDETVREIFDLPGDAPIVKP